MINKRQAKASDLNEEIIINKDIVTRRVSAVTQSLINRFVIGNRSETRNIKNRNVHTKSALRTSRQVIRLWQKRKLITV